MASFSEPCRCQAAGLNEFRKDFNAVVEQAIINDELKRQQEWATGIGLVARVLLKRSSNGFGSGNAWLRDKNWKHGLLPGEADFTDFGYDF
ncbi:MAG: hypothetical protein FJ403_13630 [Verrucomicrobia bacterium]|nr:hypothetical protein [Verrucomicrobiota bacterium]